MTAYQGNFEDNCVIRNHGEYEGCTYAELKGPLGRIAEIRVYEATGASPRVATIDINPKALPKRYSRTDTVAVVAGLIDGSPNGLSPEYKSLISRGLARIDPEFVNKQIRTAFPLGEHDIGRGSWATFEPLDTRLLNKIKTPRVVVELKTPPLEELAKTGA